MSTGRSKTRVLRIALAAFAAVVLAAVAFAWTALYTESGSRWLLGRAHAFLPEGLAWQSFEGTIASPFELRSVEFRHGALRGRLERVRVQWRPFQLLDAVVRLDSVRITGAWLAWDTAHVEAADTATSSRSDSSAGSWQVFWDRLSVSGGVVDAPRGLSLHEIELSSAGGLDSFQVTLQSRCTFDTLADVEFALTGRGDLLHLDCQELLLSKDTTRCVARGRVEWQPRVAWKVWAEVSGLNPAAWSDRLSRLDGSLRLVGSSQGQLGDAGPEFSVAVNTLAGLLAGAPIRGEGALVAHGSVLRADSIRIDWNRLSAEVQGEFGDTVDLSWHLQASDLTALSQAWAGRVWVAGEAHGPKDSLDVRGKWRASRLTYGSFVADSAEGELNWAGGADLPSALRARLWRAGRSGWLLDSLALDAVGTRAAHTVRLAASGPHRAWQALLEGAYDSLWHARVESLSVVTPTSGEWRLVRPTGLLAGSNRVAVDELCLQGENGSLCVTGAHQSAEVWQVETRFESLATDWLTRLLSADVKCDSRLDGSVKLASTSDGILSVGAQLTAAPGTLLAPALSADTVHTDSIEVALEWGPASGRLEARGGLAQGDLRLPFDLNLMLPGTARVRTELARDTSHWEMLPWSGELTVDPLALNWLDPLLPKDVRLGGTAALHVAAASQPDGRITGACDLALPPGRMLVWTGTDTLAVDWAASTFFVHADSSGTRAQAHSELSTEGERIGRIQLDLQFPDCPAVNQSPLDLPVAGTVEVAIDLAPLAPFVASVSGLAGKLEVHTAIGGTPRDLALEGSLALVAEGFVQDLGIQLSQVQLSMSAAGGQTTVRGSATSGAGTLEVSGTVSRLPSREAPSRLHVQGKDFLALDTRQASVWISPDLELAMFGDSLDLSGHIEVSKANIEILKLPEQAVAVSPDEVIVGDTSTSAGPRSPFWSQVTLALGDHVFFKGFDVTAFLGGSLEVRQKPGLDALARGEVVCREGRYRGMGQDLLIDPGRLVFSGPLLDPTIDALAYRRAVDHTKAGFKVTGRLSAPQVDLYSDPMKSEQDIMAYILFGRSANAGSESEQLKASEAAAYLGGNLLASQAASKVGLDEARIDPGYTGNDAALVAGKYISPQLFVGYGTGLFETLHTLRVRYIVSTHISLEAETGTRETADVIYQIERGK